MAERRHIRLFALDVDGTLTDGGVIYGAQGAASDEFKRFHIHDGLGIVLAGLVGLRIAWITGRQSPLVERRARELSVEFVLQGVRDKSAALQELAVRLRIAPDDVAYMGDDLNDIPALRFAGFAVAPANAVPEVKALADLITPRAGGDGAVRDAIEAILRERGDYAIAVEAYVHSLSARLSPGAQ